jgi:hypothetical protein
MVILLFLDVCIIINTINKRYQTVEPITVQTTKQYSTYYLHIPKHGRKKQYGDNSNVLNLIVCHLLSTAKSYFLTREPLCLELIG